MGKRVDVETFAASQYAIRNYMHSKIGNDYMHEARVLVSSMGKTKYNSILKVIPRIETNNSSIDIIGDAHFERDFYGKYTNEYQTFAFINDKEFIMPSWSFSLSNRSLCSFVIF